MFKYFYFFTKHHRQSLNIVAIHFTTMIESILPVERIDKSQTRAHTERRVEQQNHGHNYVEQIPSVTVTQLYSYALMNSIVLISIPPHPRKQNALVHDFNFWASCRVFLWVLSFVHHSPPFPNVRRKYSILDSIYCRPPNYCGITVHHHTDARTRL